MGLAHAEPTKEDYRQATVSHTLQLSDQSATYMFTCVEPSQTQW